MSPDLLGLEKVREAPLWLLSLSPTPAPGSWPPLVFCLPGITTAPDENPAQWVFLPSDGDWGTHLQVSKGIQPCDLHCVGPSGHIAKIWTLRWEKDTLRIRGTCLPVEMVAAGLGLVWSQEGILWQPDRKFMSAVWRGHWIESMTLERDQLVGFSAHAQNRTSMHSFCSPFTGW